MRVVEELEALFNRMNRHELEEAEEWLKENLGLLQRRWREGRYPLSQTTCFLFEQGKVFKPREGWSANGVR